MSTIFIYFFCVSDTDGLLQLHQDFTTHQQHSSVHVWNIRLQPHLCLHCESCYIMIEKKAVSFIVVCFREVDSPLMQDCICSDYLLDSRGRDSKVWCFLPLSSLSSLAEAHAELDTIYCMCIILLSPVPKGNGSKYLMHVIGLYKNRSGLQSFSTNLLRPFSATNIQRWPVLQLYPKTDRVNIFSLWDRQTAVTVRAG